MALLTCFRAVLFTMEYVYVICPSFPTDRVRSILGVTYVAIKVGMILAVEAGIFPLMCGWWIDICAFVSTTDLFEVPRSLIIIASWCSLQSLFGSTMSSRQESLQRAPGKTTVSYFVCVPHT